MKEKKNLAGFLGPTEGSREVGVSPGGGGCKEGKETHYAGKGFSVRTRYIKGLLGKRAFEGRITVGEGTLWRKDPGKRTKVRIRKVKEKNWERSMGKLTKKNTNNQTACIIWGGKERNEKCVVEGKRGKYAKGKNYRRN